MGCTKQNTKKYLTRRSPPYPANECPNARKKGNDGQWYRSQPASNGIHRWQVEKRKTKSRRADASSSETLKKGKSYELQYRRPALKIKVYYIGTFGDEVCFSTSQEGVRKRHCDYELLKYGKTFYNARDMSKVGVKAIRTN